MNVFMAVLAAMHCCGCGDADEPQTSRAPRFLSTSLISNDLMHDGDSILVGVADEEMEVKSATPYRAPALPLRISSLHSTTLLDAAVLTPVPLSCDLVMVRTSDTMLPPDRLPRPERGRSASRASNDLMCSPSSSVASSFVHVSQPSATTEQAAAHFEDEAAALATDARSGSDDEDLFAHGQFRRFSWENIPLEGDDF